MSAAVAAVLSVNVLLSLLCWWVVWRLWAIGHQVSRWGDELDAAESQVSELLTNAPQMIQSGVAELRSTQQRAQQLYQQAQVAIARLQQFRRILNLVGTVLMWGRSRRFFG